MLTWEPAADWKDLVATESTSLRLLTRGQRTDAARDRPEARVYLTNRLCIDDRRQVNKGSLMSVTSGLDS